MKKLFAKFSLILLIFTLCLTATSCSFITDSGNKDHLPNSLIESQKVTFGTLGSATGDSSVRQKLDLEDAVDMVKRTSVSVIMENGGLGSAILVDVSFNSNVVNDENCVYILTCHHVIAGKGVINITIPDKEFGIASTYENPDYVFAGVIGKSTKTAYRIGDDAKSPVDTVITLVGGDADSDVAVLKLDLNKRAISGKKLSKADLVLAKVPPTTYKPRVGESVFAVGNPTGNLPGTVSSGIISYLERDVSVENVGSMRLTQIDVLTNPGSSGGGLYNLYGELIGITNSGLEQRHGLNNAIPLSVIADDGMDNGFVNVASSLIATCTYDGDNGNFGYLTGRRVKFGFTVTKETISGKEYVKVVSVNAGTPSAQAGLKANDYITKLKVNSTEYNITSYKQFTEKMATLKINDTVVLTVPRTVAFEQIDTTITLKVSQFIFCDTGVYPVK